MNITTGKSLKFEFDSAVIDGMVGVISLNNKQEYLRMRLMSASLFLLLIAGTLGCKPIMPTEQTASDQQKEVRNNKTTQKDIDALAEHLIVRYRLITNVPTEKCRADVADGACFEVELSFTARHKLLAKGWAIYFSQISPVQSVDSQWFDIQHVNGDLHLMTLKESFQGFEAGETKTARFRANFWSLSETDALPNYIVHAQETQARVIESTKVKIDPETGLEILPYVEPYTDTDKHFKRTANDHTQWLTSERLYHRNQAVNAKNVDVRHEIIPTPSALQVMSEHQVALNKGLNIHWHNVDEKQVVSALQRLEKMNIGRHSDGFPLHLVIEADDSKKMGSYQLSVNAQAITIKGVDANGVFNGLQSLAALVSLPTRTVPEVNVTDEPHYAFRGMLIDVARNFRSKVFILKLLDQMAAYKLNKLHLHLGDDEGWRLEIPSLPELTEVSSKRCFDPSETQCLMPQLGAGIEANSTVNGYYSVSDYQEILQAASARYIQVIPSLDMPGHSRAAVKAMSARYEKYMAKEQEDKAIEFLLHDIDDKTQYSSVQYYNDNTINVCMESSYAFVEQVMRDVKAMHQQAGQPLTRYHIGADETAGAWLESPQCKAFLAKHNADITDASELGAYFVERTANMLADLGIEAAAWIDGLEHTNPENMPAVVQANAWNPLMFGGHQSSHKVANNRWQVVVSSPDVTYFDFPYEADPKEHGYYWASRQINTEKVFQFMPDNLPVHAEFWLDRENNPYVADDTVRKDEQGKVVSAPLAQGVKFYGVQGQLWSENTRTDTTAQYKIFPRLLALAERGWHQANWAVPYNYQGFKYSQNTNTFTAANKTKRDTAWQRFAQTIAKKELAKMELDDIHYRLPTVGAKIIDGTLHANIAYPSLPIEYKDGDNAWQRYTQAVNVEGNVLIRSRSFDGKRVGRSLAVVEQNH